MLKENEFSLLFTGGLDSTYRFCQLAQQKNITVQPIYIVNPIRKHTQLEIKAQDKILEYVKAHPHTQAQILPLKYISIKDIINYKYFREVMAIKQNGRYPWRRLFAIYALQDYGVELCCESYKNVFLTENTIHFKTIKNHRFIDFYKMNEKDLCIFLGLPKINKDLINAFSKIAWPILGVTRQQMQKDIAEWGYEEIWQKIWFCSMPISDSNCGLCLDCQLKLRQGLDFLFSNEAIKRYLVFNIIKNNYPVAMLDMYKNYIRRKNFKVNGFKEKYWLKQIQEFENKNIIELKDILNSKE